MIDVVNRHLAALAAGNWSDYKADLAPNAVYDEPSTMRRAEGADEYVKAVQVWKHAFPDLKATVLATYASGNDRVITEVEWDGTHSAPLEGPFGPIPASNKHGSVRAAMIFTIANGRITETRHYFDLLTVLRQIGVAPAVGAPAPSAQPAAEQPMHH